jgi:alpha-tubulin suppressor-like RCC1 family protein
MKNAECLYPEVTVFQTHADALFNFHLVNSWRNGWNAVCTALHSTVALGQTGATYTISSPCVADSGRYTVSVMSNMDTVESDTARSFAMVKSVAAGGYHSLILKTDGSLLACGLNVRSQVVDSTGINRHVPVRIFY